MMQPCRHNRLFLHSHFVDGIFESCVQEVIEELDVVERLRKALALTKRELNLAELTQKMKEYEEETINHICT